MSDVVYLVHEELTHGPSGTLRAYWIVNAPTREDRAWPTRRTVQELDAEVRRTIPISEAQIQARMYRPIR